MGRKIPAIATMEGFAGGEMRERQLRKWVGHNVFCQRVPGELLRRIDWVLNAADHVIAINPFIAEMGIEDLELNFPPGYMTTCVTDCWRMP